jgi:hypothetical protein
MFLGMFKFQLSDTDGKILVYVIFQPTKHDNVEIVIVGLDLNVGSSGNGGNIFINSGHRNVNFLS